MVIGQTSPTPCHTEETLSTAQAKMKLESPLTRASIVKCVKLLSFRQPLLSDRAVVGQGNTHLATDVCTRDGGINLKQSHVYIVGEGSTYCAVSHAVSKAFHSRPGGPALAAQQDIAARIYEDLAEEAGLMQRLHPWYLHMAGTESQIWELELQQVNFYLLLYGSMLARSQCGAGCSVVMAG